MQELFRMGAINTSQPVSTTIMTAEDEPLHTAVPSNDEVWKRLVTTVIIIIMDRSVQIFQIYFPSSFG